MKYIRTKDGNIYETKDLIKCEDNHYPNGWFTKSGVPLTAIKESDNIEDLLDGYVVRNELVRYLDIAKAYSKEFGEPVYGAIWTQKGLIYIAKLTDEGWELV